MVYFKDVFDLYFFSEYLKDKRKLSESSRYNYLKAVEKFTIEHRSPYDINEYNKFLIQHTIKSRSNYYYSALKTYIKYKVKDAGERNMMIENLVTPELPDSPKIERKYLSEDDIIRIINNIKTEKHRVIALIQDLTGVRAGDVLSIKRGDIIPEIYDGANVLKIVIVGKGKKRNVVYVHDDIVQALIMNYIINNYNEQDYYFIEDKRRRLRENTFSEHVNYKSNYVAYHRDLKRALDRAGFNPEDFASHDYRRCYARRVWTRYKDLHVLQGLLNHSNADTTMRYLKHSGLKNVDYHKAMQE